MAQHRDLVPITVYVPPDVLAKLEQQARAEYATVSAVARRIIGEWADSIALGKVRRR